MRENCPESSCTVARLLRLGLLPLAALACTPSEQGQPAAFSLLDSAGTTIATSTAPSWAPGEGWRLAGVPTLTIGDGVDDARYLFTDAHAARRLDDGRIAVLDTGAAQVRVYSADGVHLFDVGGAGDGPAEFRYPQHLSLASDSLVVYDPSLRKVVWFTPEGHFVRSERAGGVEESGLNFGLARGTIHNDHLVLAFRRRERPATPQTSQAPFDVWRSSLRQAGSDYLLRVLGFEEEWFESERGLGRRPVLFGRTTHVAARGSTIAVSGQVGFEVGLHDSTGASTLLMRRPSRGTAVSESILADVVSEYASGSDLTAEEAEEFERGLRARPVADSIPEIRSLTIDASGNVWAERFDWPGRGVPGAFSVFDPRGRWLGDVEVPAGLHSLRSERSAPLEIGTDYVLGVWENEYGASVVRLYELIKR